MQDKSQEQAPSVVPAMHVDGIGYGKLIDLVMRCQGMSIRCLAEKSGVQRKKISRIIAGADTTRSEERAIYAALGIDMIRAVLAVDHRRNPEHYFEAYLETAAEFSVQLTTALDEQAEARVGTFEPIKKQLLTPLVMDVTARVMKHQDLVQERATRFMG